MRLWRKLTFAVAKKVPGVVAYLYLGRRAKAALCHSGTDLSGAVASTTRLILDRHVRFVGRSWLPLSQAENEKACVKGNEIDQSKI